MLWDSQSESVRRYFSGGHVGISGSIVGAVVFICTIFPHMHQMTFPEILLIVPVWVALMYGVPLLALFLNHHVQERKTAKLQTSDATV